MFPKVATKFCRLRSLLALLVSTVVFLIFSALNSRTTAPLFGQSLRFLTRTSQFSNFTIEDNRRNATTPISLVPETIEDDLAIQEDEDANVDLSYIFLKRREQVRKTCKKYFRTDPSKLKLGSFPNAALAFGSSHRYILVDHVRKFVFCRIPKIASTAWKKVLIMLSSNGVLTEDDLNDELANNETIKWSPNLVPLRDLSNKEFQKVMDTYVKVMWVRNPFDRIISAWRDKLTGKNEKYSKSYASAIAKKYRRKMTTSKIRVHNETTISNSEMASISLEEFFTYLTHEGHRTSDVHWGFMHNQCLTCFIDWDIIGRFEHLETEFDFLMRRILLAKPAVKLPRPMNNATKTSYVDELAKLPRHLIKSVAEIYGIDLQMFGYTNELKRIAASLE